VNLEDLVIEVILADQDLRENQVLVVHQANQDYLTALELPIKTLKTYV